MSAYRRMFFPAYATSNYDSTHCSHLTSIVIWTRVVLVSITTSCDSVPMLLQLPLMMTSSMITYTPFPSCVVPYGNPSQLCPRSTMTSIGVNIHTREHQTIEKIPSLQHHTIFTTLLPSTRPARLLAWILTWLYLRAKSSSHHPKRKSRAMSLNQGVNEFAANVRVSIANHPMSPHWTSYMGPRTSPSALPCSRTCDPGSR